MSDKQKRVIKRIDGHEPRRDNEWPVGFSVGESGVTRIEYDFIGHGVSKFNVYKGGELHATIYETAVAEVYYETEGVAA